MTNFNYSAILYVCHYKFVHVLKWDFSLYFCHVHFLFFEREREKIKRGGIDVWMWKTVQCAQKFCCFFFSLASQHIKIGPQKKKIMLTINKWWWFKIIKWKLCQLIEFPCVSITCQYGYVNFQLHFHCYSN